MQNKLFVGGLPWAVDSNRLREIFSEFGEVVDAHVALDRETRRSRGFGFVEFANAEQAQSAISALDGKELDGRTVTVNVAQPKQ
jgi:cold-inducible RNA-binding protein